jgi:hypothetical protein
MWTFHQPTGVLEDILGYRCGAGYAGRGEGKNNPILQDVRQGARWDDEAKQWVPVDGLSDEDWGPLPCGVYDIQSPVDTPKHGPYVMWLTPDASNTMFGRSAFGIHGDSIEHPGLASEGCMCFPRITREKIWMSGDHKLRVVAE